MGMITVQVDGYRYEIEISPVTGNGSGVSVRVGGTTVNVQVLDPETPADEMTWFIVDGRPVEAAITPDLNWIETRWGSFPLAIRDQASMSVRPNIGDGRIKAPIPGKITQVLVAQGDFVKIGQTLLVLEAMKMENLIRAPRDGKIELLNTAVGKTVLLDELLLEIE